MTPKQWRVVFNESSAVLVSAVSADMASLEARLGLWLLTGRWMRVERVEAVL